MNQESVIKDQWYGYNKKLAQVAGEGVTLHGYLCLGYTPRCGWIVQYKYINTIPI